ncbi:PH domain-containing protein [Paraburkholderia caballeronis]|uniref:PH domain-containing protein n=1 Tax=Paraburkholderia caballeronis TaxID=416943 RepID=UPI001AB03003
MLHRRSVVAATTGRLIGLDRGLIGGFTPVDIRWQDIKSAHIKAGIFGSTLRVTALTMPISPSVVRCARLNFPAFGKTKLNRSTGFAKRKNRHGERSGVSVNWKNCGLSRADFRAAWAETDHP